MYKSRTWLEAALEQKPHFLRTQVAHKPHSYRSRSSKTVPWCCRCRTKSFRFSHAKCLFTFENFFWNNRNLKFHFHFTCARPLLRLLQTQDFANKPPSHKSGTWIEAAPKSWKIAHMLRLFYTTLRYMLVAKANASHTNNWRMHKELSPCIFIDFFLTPPPPPPQQH